MPYSQAQNRAVKKYRNKHIEIYREKGKEYVRISRLKWKGYKEETKRLLAINIYE